MIHEDGDDVADNDDDDDGDDGDDVDDGDDGDDRDDGDAGDDAGLSGRARSLVINAHELILVSRESCCRLHPDILTSLLFLSSSLSLSSPSPSP